MTVPDAAAALPLPVLPAAGAELAAEPLLVELPHAAASSAAATGTPSFTGIGIRVSNELAMSYLHPGLAPDAALRQVLTTQLPTEDTPKEIGRCRTGSYRGEIPEADRYPWPGRSVRQRGARATSISTACPRA